MLRRFMLVAMLLTLPSIGQAQLGRGGTGDRRLGQTVWPQQERGRRESARTRKCKKRAPDPQDRAWPAI